MAKTFRKKAHKKYLVQEEKLELDGPNFHNMSREEVEYYLENYETRERKTSSKKKQISSGDDSFDF